MPAAAAGTYYPTQQHLRICEEADWGVCPEQPNWQSVPIHDGEFTVRASQLWFAPATAFGGSTGRPALPEMESVAGCLATELRPQTAGLLLDAALDRTGGRLRSYCMDHYTPAGSWRLCGVKADRLLIAARPGRALAVFDFLGRREQANAGLAEGDFDYSGIDPVPFRFGGATVRIDGTEATDVEEVRVTVENSVAAGPDIGALVGYLAAGQRRVRVGLRKVDRDDALRSALRDGATVALQVILDHPQGHSLQLEVPCLCAEDYKPLAEADRPVRAEVRCGAAADQTGGNIYCNVSLNL
jgi:hypothetical protein